MLMFVFLYFLLFITDLQVAKVFDFIVKLKDNETSYFVEELWDFKPYSQSDSYKPDNKHLINAIDYYLEVPNNDQLNGLNTIIYDHIKNRQSPGGPTSIHLVIKGINDDARDHEKAIDEIRKLKDNNTGFFVIEGQERKDPFLLSKKFDNLMAEHGRYVFFESTGSAVILSFITMLIKKIFLKRLPNIVLVIPFLLPYIAKLRYIKPFVCNTNFATFHDFFGNKFATGMTFLIAGLLVWKSNQLLNG
jgi:hypothetical protein